MSIVINIMGLPLPYMGPFPMATVLVFWTILVSVTDEFLSMSSISIISKLTGFLLVLTSLFLNFSLLTVFGIEVFPIADPLPVAGMLRKL